MGTTPTPTLEQRLTQAQQAAQTLREQLFGLEHDLEVAVQEKRFEDAATLKANADELRQPTLIAEAEVTALQAGMTALEEQRRIEQQAEQDRLRVEQATAVYERCHAAEQTAMDEMDRCLADLAPAYEALRRTMAAALDAQQRAYQARLDGWQSGMAAGVFPADSPQPPPPNRATARIDWTPVLGMVWRTPDLSV